MQPYQSKERKAKNKKERKGKEKQSKRKRKQKHTKDKKEECQRKQRTKDDERKKRNAKHKDEKRKPRKRMESTIKGKKQKRAKGINKSEPPRRARKAVFLASILPRPYNIATKERKAHTLRQKRQKRRFLLLCAYHRQKAKQYKCDTSVLCLYYYAVLLYWGHPLCHTQPLRCLLKKFFPKILALGQNRSLKIFLFNFFICNFAASYL